MPTKQQTATTHPFFDYSIPSLSRYVYRTHRAERGKIFDYPIRRHCGDYLGFLSGLQQAETSTLFLRHWVRRVLFGGWSALAGYYEDERDFAELSPVPT